jgi:hypothetical protein
MGSLSVCIRRKILTGHRTNKLSLLTMSDKGIPLSGVDVWRNAPHRLADRNGLPPRTLVRGVIQPDGLLWSKWP